MGDFCARTGSLSDQMPADRCGKRIPVTDILDADDSVSQRLSQDKKRCVHIGKDYMYSGTSKLGTPKGLSKTVLNSEVVLFLRSNSMYGIDQGTEVAVLNSQVVLISQVVLKTGYTV